MRERAVAPLVALIALGNSLRGDDAIGPMIGERVAARLRDRAPRPARESLTFRAGPLDALAIVDAWSGTAAAFVIDAALCGGPPGTVTRLELGPGAQASVRPRELARPSSHGLGLHEAIALGSALARLPGRIVCYAVEIGDLGYGRAPGPALIRAVETAAMRVADEILAAWHHRSPRPGDTRAGAGPAEHETRPTRHETMNEANTREAARLIWTAWQAGERLAALPAHCRPADRAEGYAIQRAVMQASGRTGFGWKIAATSAAGQAHIGVDGPLAGRLLTGQIDESGATVSLRGTQMRVAEVEFAFRMARDLPPRAEPYATGEVLDAVATLHPAIEIPDSRYEDFVQAGAPQLIADNACAHRFVLGTPTGADWRTLDLRAHTVDCVVGACAALQGKGENVLGDPRIALTWLANELRASGQLLRAGEVVTTGTCLAPIPVSPGERLVADFGVIGRVEAGFAD